MSVAGLSRMTALSMMFCAPLMAYQSSEAFLEEMDLFLTNRQMGKILPKGRLVEL